MMNKRLQIPDIDNTFVVANTISILTKQLQIASLEALTHISSFSKDTTSRSS